MRIGLDVQLLGDPLQDVAYLLALIVFPGMQKSKLQLLDQVQKLNTELWPLLRN